MAQTNDYIKQQEEELKFKLAERRLTYIRLKNKEKQKECAGQEFDHVLIKACNRFLKKYTKPVFTAKADGKVVAAEDKSVVTFM